MNQSHKNHQTLSFDLFPPLRLLRWHDLEGTFMQALEFCDYDQTVSSVACLLILKININSTDSGP